jgi:hypothetical protein
MARLRRSGRITFLRVNDRGGFGPNDDFIDVEAIGKISSEPTHGFGFTLRDDDRLPSHQGMLDLLRDGIIHNQLQTTVEYDLEDGRTNGLVIRVELRPT